MIAFVLYPKVLAPLLRHLPFGVFGQWQISSYFFGCAASDSLAQVVAVADGAKGKLRGVGADRQAAGYKGP